MKLFSLSIPIFSLFIPVMVFAAQISITPPAQIGVGDQFIVPITLETEGDSINAIDGDLSYPTDMLTIREVRDGNSIVNFWLERPADVGGAIHFSGIIPGGYADHSGEIFTLVFQAKSSGSARLSLSKAHALKNDGQGSAASLKSTFPAFTILSAGNGLTVPEQTAEDRIAPEQFTPSVSSDPSVFDGRYFVVFATQDKGSGVDHYEIAESSGFQWFGLRARSWSPESSPHVLADQTLRSYIYVKAVDRAGNKYVAALSPLHQRFFDSVWGLLAILIVTLLLLERGIRYVISYIRASK